MRISKLAESVSPSPIRKMFNLALKYEDALRLTLGEPDFSASENVVNAANNANISGNTKYTANAGLFELREAISEYIEKDTAMKYSAEDEVAVTIGAIGALYLSILALVNPGDEVIIFAPFWNNYQGIVKMAGGVPVFVSTYEENAFDLDVDDLKSAISDKTKVIMINSPSNPTGGVFSKNTLEEIAKIALEKDLVVLSDEVYNKILFDGNKFESIATLKDMRDRTVIINSFSKTYAMTGWRVGYVAAAKDIAYNITKLQENIAASAATSCQIGAIEALRGPQDHVNFMVNEYDKRRKFVYDKINSIDKLSCLLPKATFYSFFNIKKTGLSSEEFAMRFLEEEKVVLVPGNAFGDAGEGFVRLSFASSMEVLEEGLKRMEKFVSKL